jgi:hypothetical protein
VVEIIHLGDYWNESQMRANREGILQSNARVGRLFKIAYCSLKEAQAIMDEWESYISEAQCFAKVNELTYKILQDISAKITPQFRETLPSRHLFASAITPKGPQTHWTTILQGVTSLYSIQGLPGSGKSTLISRVAEMVENLGLFAEVYHRPLDPKKLDGVVIPALKIAVVNTGLPFTFDNDKISGLSVTAHHDLSAFLDQSVLQTYATEIAETTERFRNAFNRGSEYIRQSKAEHDVMETFYVPAMDFTAIEAKRDETLQRILKYAEEVGQA